MAVNSTDLKLEWMMLLCHYACGITPRGLGLAFFRWFGLFLVIGFIESWLIFRRAMLEQKVRCGLPYGFACLCPILTCLTLLTVKKYLPKTHEHKRFLLRNGKECLLPRRLVFGKEFLSQEKPCCHCPGVSLRCCTTASSSSHMVPSIRRFQLFT